MIGDIKFVKIDNNFIIRMKALGYQAREADDSLLVLQTSQGTQKMICSTEGFELDDTSWLFF